LPGSSKKPRSSDDEITAVNKGEQSRCSIHELDPLETGGTEARKGFSFQDHVAACFCLDMLDDEMLLQVWCESQDDITLIWSEDDAEAVEFIQVKKNEPDQLWSAAMLCKRESKKGKEVVGSSILEKSLAYDRPFREPRRFRMVTARPPNDELKCLTYKLTSKHRNAELESVDALLRNLDSRVGNYKSPSGNSCNYWAENTIWDCRHSDDSIRDSNLHKLRALVEQSGQFLAHDQEEALYTQLLQLVNNAAAADTKSHPELKKLSRQFLLSWFDRKVTDAAHPASRPAGKALKEKLTQAGLASDVIQTAQEQRQRYRTELLKAKYLHRDNHQRVDGEILARLQTLRAQLDSDSLANNGPEFHCRCLKALDALRDDLQIEPPPPLFILQGSMYAMTDRCIHRFKKVTA